MTAVFVHGNPESAAIWGPLFEALDRDDLVPLSPPGFGAPVPDGFGATADDYADWLEAELEARPEPVDLVGHDWGGGHVMRVACRRPDLIRSWCTDIAGCFAPDYVWHDLAQVWQTPGAGEDFVANTLAAPVADRAGMYEALGMPSEVARAVAEAFDETLGECMLKLYRSAAQPAMSQWGAEVSKAAARPGLVIIPTDDTFTGGEERARQSAARAGAAVEVLDGLGHWWMLQDPRRGAEALTHFWAGLEG